MYSKDSKDYINVFSNVDKSNNEINMDEMAKNFLFILKTNLKFYIKPKENKIKKIKDIKKYLGRYENDYTFYEVFTNDNKLYLFSRKQINRLLYLGKNKFYRNAFSYIVIKIVNYIFIIIIIFIMK